MRGRAPSRAQVISARMHHHPLLGRLGHSYGQVLCLELGPFIVMQSLLSLADLGTRPGPYSQTLVSSGHAELDRLLGGGLPLGSLTLILEDGTSRHHATLLRYFLAEGAACGQVRCGAGQITAKSVPTGQVRQAQTRQPWLCAHATD